MGLNPEFLRNPVYKVAALILSTGLVAGCTTPPLPQRTDTSASKSFSPVTTSVTPASIDDRLILVGECQSGGILDANQRTNRIRHTKIIDWILNNTLSTSIRNSLRQEDLASISTIAKRYSALEQVSASAPQDDARLCEIFANTFTHDDPRNLTEYGYDFQGVEVNLENPTLRSLYGPVATGAVNIRFEFNPLLIVPQLDFTDGKTINPNPFKRYNVHLLLGNGSGKPFLNPQDFETAARAWLAVPNTVSSAEGTRTLQLATANGGVPILERWGRILDDKSIVTWSASEIGWTNIEVINPNNFR